MAPLDPLELDEPPELELLLLLLCPELDDELLEEWPLLPPLLDPPLLLEELEVPPDVPDPPLLLLPPVSLPPLHATIGAARHAAKRTREKTLRIMM